jgi:molecular chaperone GrpE (heat shock protein)|tara:strand:- start:890 stop:1087 length:198 start_codon:yes stop_codon:yes gene_type:complete
MQTDKAQERITELETELKTMQDNYNQALQVMENCKVRIIAIQASIAERKLDLPEESRIEETVATG